METRSIFSWLRTILLLSVTSYLLPLSAQEPVITFHTTLYDDDGESNSFSLALGATTAGTYVGIDCGYGTEQVEVGQAYIEGDSTLVGSTFTGSVSENGVVKIYCDDPSKLDYFNASGCYITDIEFSPKLTSMQILNLEYNTLAALNVDSLKNLSVLYLRDNPFTKETPLNIGYLPKMTVLEVAQVGYISPQFRLSNFPNLQSFDAYHCLTLKSVDSSENPCLKRLSLDMTNVSSVDVTRNPSLIILNVSDTKVRTLDLSQNAALQELYCNHSSGTLNTDVNIDSIDVSHNPELYYFFAAGNNFEKIDLSNNPKLFDLSVPYNHLKSIDLSANTALYNVNISNNYMDYATLPLPKSTWSTYYYYQHDLQCQETYKVGDVVDFSARVLRDGTTTSCRMYYIEKDDPTNGIELPDSCYSYADGRIRLLRPWDKQVYAVFSNDCFTEYDLYTSRFRIKTEKDYGKDEKAIEIASDTPTGREIALAVGIVGATDELPVTVSADFGDGSLQTFRVTSETPEASNIKGIRPAYGNICVYVPQDKHVSSIVTDGLSITNIDLSGLTELSTLKLKNAGLYKIALDYNSKLQTLDLSGNNLSTFSLKSNSYYYSKSMLRDVNLSNNQLTTFEFNDLYAIKNINLSHNKLTTVDFTDADNLVAVDVSCNQFEELLFNNSDSLLRLDVSDNILDTLYVPSDAPLAYCNISSNPFTLADMPGLIDRLSRQASSLSSAPELIYAPQNTLQIASTSPGIDLSSQYLTIDGKTTQYTWKKEDGTALVEGTDYTVTNGNTRFLTTTCGKIYCEMTHAALPQFIGENVFRTTLVTPIGLPSIEIASFTTTEDGNSVELSLAANNDGTSVYFDWNGDGNVTQYTLKTTYTRFNATTKANTKVRVLVADHNDTFSVFSITGARMSDIDLSGLRGLYSITVAGAGLESIGIPQINGLGELNLSNNKLSEFDFTKCPNLYYLSLNGNKFKNIDLGQLEGLGLAYLGNNEIETVKLNNTVLWNLDLGGNRLSAVDFAGVPNLEQLWVNDNNLTSIDVDRLSSLKVLDLVRNRFTFVTLPLKKTNWAVYSYGKQQNLNVTADVNVVDLGYMAHVGDSVTTYRWFAGTPSYDTDTGEFTGEELSADADYVTDNGVTTFNLTSDKDNIVGVIQNPEFPNLILYTNPFAVKSVATGIVSVGNRQSMPDAGKTDGCRMYNLLGQRVGMNTHGIIINSGRKIVTHKR